MPGSPLLSVSNYGIKAAEVSTASREKQAKLTAAGAAQA